MGKFVRAFASPLIFFSAILNCADVFAIPQKTTFKPYGVGTTIRSGVVVGGTAGQALSIVRISKLGGAGGSERLVVVYGDQNGSPLKGEPGYFHIQVDESPARVSIDLVQVLTTAVDNEELSRIFSDSRLVSATEMTMDPLDKSTNILLTMKRPVEVRASLKKDHGTQLLMIDFKPLPGTRSQKTARAMDE